MIYEDILQRVIFPISTKIMKRNFWKYYNWLQKSQRYTNEEIENIQLKKLKKLVKHVYNNVPMYKELMDNAKVKPSDINKLADLSKLPIVTKSNFRIKFPERCTAKNISKKKWMPDSTSGSTGKPFQFIRDKEFSDWSLANTYRGYTWTGARIGCKIALLWGYHHKSLSIAILDKIMRRKMYSSFDVEKNYLKYYKSLISYKPRILEAYSSSVTHFAKLLMENNLNKIYIPSVISSAETLYHKNRKLIEKILHTEVYNRYGSREVGNVAQECNEHNGLHINAESYIVEVVKEKQTDKYGRLIVTNLTNYTMPFIRYDTEDYATGIIKECKCGRGLPLIKSIEGRKTDFILLPNGKELSFLFFNYFFEQYGAYVKQFQVIQDERNHLIIKLVPTERYSTNKEKEVLFGIKKKVGDMIISIQKVSNIEKEKSGKIRPVKRLI